MHPVAIKVSIIMLCVSVMLDQSQSRRVIIATIALGLYGWYLYTNQKNDNKDFDIKKKATIIQGLHVPYVASNPRIVGIFHKLRALRKFNESDFSTALQQTDTLLANASLKSPNRPNDQELVLMKDRVINTIAQYAFRLPKLFEEKMKFSEKLKVLDTVLYLETIRSPNEVFPLPSTASYPYSYTGHDTSTTPFHMTSP
jgi:hypothetical protein